MGKTPLLLTEAEMKFSKILVCQVIADKWNERERESLGFCEVCTRVRTHHWGVELTTFWIVLQLPQLQSKVQEQELTSE